MKNQTRPVPADFRENAAFMPVYKLQKHYAASGSVVLRWFAETGAPRLTFEPHNKRPVPDDYSDRAMEMHKAALLKHYTVREETLARWVAETGIRPIPYLPPRKQRTKRPSGGMRANLRAVGVINLASVRTWDEADDAANRLRKFGPVNRCNEDGSFNHCGKFWRVGWAVLSGDELIERANRRRAA